MKTVIAYLADVMSFKGLVQRFSQQAVMNKCFLLNRERKKLAQIRAAILEKDVKTV